MHVINAEELELVKEMAKVNGVVAEWLIYKGNCSPFGMSKDKNYYYFVITEEFENACKNMPFYMKLFLPNIKRGGAKIE